MLFAVCAGSPVSTILIVVRAWRARNLALYVPPELEAWIVRSPVLPSCQDWKLYCSNGSCCGRLADIVWLSPAGHAKEAGVITGTASTSTVRPAGSEVMVVTGPAVKVARRVPALGIVHSSGFEPVGPPVTFQPTK